ncbi:response regulator [uncultured Abyssibacter sp.]|uniref:response regulator n=1 Tax=uncultured Abyssibacter sp. TaxID=2320202 RepID=UPI0032B308C9
MNKLKEILLIDDNPADNFLHRDLIEAMDIAETINEAHDGEAAIDYLRAANTDPGRTMPDLILLDVNMPLMNGWEFLDQAGKETLLEHSIVVMMLTTSLNPDHRASAERSPELDGFLGKPLTRETVVDILATHFGK